MLTQAINWHWIFFVNLPIGIATGVAGAAAARADEPGIGSASGADVARRRADHQRADARASTRSSRPAASTAGARRARSASARAALALLAAFVAARGDAPRNPLMPLRIFRSRNVAGANVVQMLLVAGMFGMFFLGALYLQRVLGYDALEIGLAFLPVDVADRRRSRCASRSGSIMRFGARAVLLPGLALIVAGLALFARAPVDGDYLTRRPAGRWCCSASAPACRSRR